MPPNYTNPPPSGESNGDAETYPHGKLKGDLDYETYALRKLFIHVSLVVALVFVWLCFELFEPVYSPPDFAEFVELRTFNASVLDLDNPNRRIIMVGDLHGMMHSLDELLGKVDYDPPNDLLIHLGDITAKGPHSNELVSRFAGLNITGVKGNNDQKVIEWYQWISWVRSHRGGERWLETLEKQGITSTEAKEMKMYKSLKYTYSKKWDWNGDHYRIARRLTSTDYAYLSNLPIVIHLPSIHTLMVHAGLLPTDPAHHIRSLRQPLAVQPDLPPNPTEEDISAARNAQELALLTDIEPNTDPFVKLNIRDVHDLEPVRRGPPGHRDNEPWSDMWNRVIKRCRGFKISQEVVEGAEQDDDLADDQVDLSRRKKSLPCYPITVVYSHASTRGLDLKKWSKGLDTGCVNGDGLTAMILGKGRHRAPPPNQMRVQAFPNDDDDERDIEVPFGDGQRARLVSISCPTPPPIDD